MFVEIDEEVLVIPKEHCQLLPSKILLLYCFQFSNTTQMKRVLWKTSLVFVRNKLMLKDVSLVYSTWIWSLLKEPLTDCGYVARIYRCQMVQW